LLIGLVAAIAASGQQTPVSLPLVAAATEQTSRIQRGIFTSDGKVFMGAGADLVIRAWSVADGKLLYSLPKLHLQTVHALVLSGDNLLVSGSVDGGLIFWDLAERKKIVEVVPPGITFPSLSVSRTGKILAVGGFDTKSKSGKVQLWDLNRRQQIGLLEHAQRRVVSVAISPDGRRLAAAEAHGDIRVWDVEARKTIVTLYPANPITALEFTPDGKHLLAADILKGRITQWETEEWNDVAQGRGRHGLFSFMQCNARGTMLASASADGKVQLWSLGQLEEQPPLLIDQFFKDKAAVVAFSPAGRNVVSWGEDKLVRFWAIPPEVEKHFASAPAKAKVEKDVVRAGPARVALITSQPTDTARGVQDLAIVQLGNEKGIELLDRTAVERLLQEQKLSLTGLVDANTAVKVGKILAVDVLGVIEASVDAKQNASLLVFDASTGARLHDAGFDRPETDAQVREVIGGVRAGVAKWRAGTSNLKTVCFLPVRNADLPQHMDAFCAAFSASLERQLLHHPAITTLERKRLESAAQEKALSAEAATREFLASVLLLELEIGRAREGNGLRATATLRDNSGKVLRTITHAVADPQGVGLLPPVLRQVHAVLQTAEGEGLVRRGREARRFLREAELLWRHKHYRAALQAAEAAYALNPEDDARLRLAEYLIKSRSETWKREGAKLEVPPEKARMGLHLAQRGYQLIESARPRLPELHDHTSYFSLVENVECFDAVSSLMLDASQLKVVPAEEELEREIRDFRLLVLGGRVERIRELSRRTDSPIQNLALLTLGMRVAYRFQIENSAPDSENLKQALGEVMQIWLDLSRRGTVETFPTDSPRIFADMVLARAESLGLLTLAPSADKKSALDIMLGHFHPLMRLYGGHYQIRLLLASNRINKAEAEARYGQLTAEAKRLIDTLPGKPTVDPRPELYTFLVRTLQDRGRDGTPLIDEAFALAEFALKRRHVVPVAWNHATTSALFSKEHHARAVDLIQRMQEVYDAPGHRLFDDRSKLFKKNVEQQLSTILRASPHLAAKRSPAWEKATALVQLTSLKNMNVLMSPTRHGKDVYVIAGGFDPGKNNRPVLQLVRATLDGSPVQLLGRAYLGLNEHTAKPQDAFRYSLGFVTRCAIDGDRIYVATKNDGIYIFPLAGGDATHLGAKEGLPSLEVTRLATVAGKAAAFLEGGFLVLYDAAAEQCHVLASSRRTQKLSPFDNDKPFRILFLVPDLARQRFVFRILQSSFDHPNCGIWEYDLKTSAFKKLLPFFDCDASRVENDALHLAPFKREWFARFDLATNKFTLLDGKSPVGIPEQKPLGMPEKLSATFSDCLYHHGYYWKGVPFHRQSLKTGKHESFGHVFHTHMRTADFGECLEVVSDRELLVGDRRGVYLVRLPAP
jgi:hypothetical protein